MNNEITQLLVIAFAIVPFVNGVVGLVRKSIPSLKSNFVPGISFLTGIVIGALFTFLPNVNYSLVQLMMAGAIAGMAACGVYEIAKVPTSNNNN